MDDDGRFSVILALQHISENHVLDIEELLPVTSWSSAETREKLDRSCRILQFIPSLRRYR